MNEKPNFEARAEGDRLKAWELYLQASTGGKYRSLRSIASDIGVSPMTIGRWKEVDGWDEKIKKILVQTAGSAESTSQAIKRRVRRGLLDGLDELQAIATDTNLQPKDRIEAIKAISAIALKIDAVTSGAFGKEEGTVSKPVEFNDELEGTKWPQTTEQPLPLEESVDEGRESPELSPTPPMLPSPSPSSLNSVEASESLQVELPLVEEGGEQ